MAPDLQSFYPQLPGPVTLAVRWLSLHGDRTEGWRKATSWFLQRHGDLVSSHQLSFIKVSSPVKDAVGWKPFFSVSTLGEQSCTNDSTALLIPRL